jgi:hypothetical protein
MAVKEPPDVQQLATYSGRVFRCYSDPKSRDTDHGTPVAPSGTLYIVPAFSAVMWFITLAASGGCRELMEVVRIEGAKTRYLVGFVLSLAGLAASSRP